MDKWNHAIGDVGKSSVVTRTLTSCCPVARAQHLGQNGRFAQQTPRGWLRAAQHAILGAQHFSPQAKKNAVKWGIFFLIRHLGKKKIKHLFAIRRERKKN